MKRGPCAIGDVLSEVMARRGFARVQTAAAYDEAWCEAAGELAAKYSKPGAIRRGTLDVVVANSTLMQELGFRKHVLIETLAGLLPDEKIENIRFRVGGID